MQIVIERDSEGFDADRTIEKLKDSPKAGQEQYYKDLANSYEKTINKLTKAISEQEPKVGHWITCDVLQEVKCSECRVCFRHTTNYCPNCGTKMEGESEC